MSKLLTKIGKTYIINGAPGSGKSTYVKENKYFADVVLDIDYIAQCLTGTNNLYDRNQISIGLANMIYDFIIDKKTEITYSGRNLWIVTAEPDANKIEQMTKNLDAELIFLDPGIDTCKENIQKDTRRPLKTKYLHQVDKWYEKHTMPKEEYQGLNETEIVEQYKNMQQILDALNINYYVTGSITILLNYNQSLNRKYKDIDIYIPNNEILRLKDYCDNNNLIFSSISSDPSIIEGHICQITPIKDNQFHIGIIPFIPDGDNITHAEYFEQYDYLHIKRTIFDKNSFLIEYLKDKHILPYEYPMVMKLAYGREKDLKDFETAKPYLNHDIFKKIKQDFLNAKYETYIIKNDNTIRMIERGRYDEP